MRSHTCPQYIQTGTKSKCYNAEQAVLTMEYVAYSLTLRKMRSGSLMLELGFRTPSFPTNKAGCVDRSLAYHNAVSSRHMLEDKRGQHGLQVCGESAAVRSAVLTNQVAPNLAYHLLSMQRDCVSQAICSWKFEKEMRIVF